ncbi:hypothetical protein JCM10213v2_007170 [Rhodosporidiobolus nylandii]
MPALNQQTLPQATATAIDAAIAAATADPYYSVPRLVFAAGSSSSPILYSGAGGYGRLPPSPADLDKEGEKITADSCYELYSCTKLVGSIAALQLVEQGLISFNDDAAKYVPELAAAKVFKGWDEQDEPILEEKERAVTVRMLLTHTSGAVYFFHALEDVNKVAKKLGINPAPYGETATPNCLYKMPLCQPGTRWTYGTSIDWLTKIVENVTGLDLETYFQERIFRPLGITDISFNPNPSQIDMAFSPPASSPSSPYTFARNTAMSAVHRYGGAGLKGSPSSYLKLLRAILRGGAVEDGERILKPETVELMFEPQLNEKQARDLQLAEVRGSEPFSRAAGKSLEDANWGLGGMLSGTGLASGRGARSLHWSGMANTYWVIDRANDVCFVLFSNIIPYGNDAVFAAWHEIETELYKGLNSLKA